MQLTDYFLSFDDKELSETKITTELIPLLNIHVLEIYKLRNMLQNKDTSSGSKTEGIKKLRLMIDLITIYKDPTILNLIKQYRDDKNIKLSGNKNRIHQESYHLDSSQGLKPSCIMAPELKNPYTTISKTHVSDNNSDSDDEKTDISEDEFMNNYVQEMLNIGYKNILNNSILVRDYDITRNNYCEMQDNESNEMQDNDSNEMQDTDSNEMHDNDSNEMHDNDSNEMLLLNSPFKK